jgi:hypothetical protein
MGYDAVRQAGEASLAGWLLQSEDLIEIADWWGKPVPRTKE